MRFTLPSGSHRTNANRTQIKAENIAKNANGLIKIAISIDVFSVMLFKD